MHPFQNPSPSETPDERSVAITPVPAGPWAACHSLAAGGGHLPHLGRLAGEGRTGRRATGRIRGPRGGTSGHPPRPPPRLAVSGGGTMPVAGDRLRRIRTPI